MKRKITEDVVKQVFIDTTFNNMSQAEAARKYGVSQPCLSNNLRAYMMKAYAYDVNNPKLTTEQKADWYGLTPEQYTILSFRARCKLMV